MSCDSGYELYDHKCFIELPNCNAYDNYGCINCNTNFALY